MREPWIPPPELIATIRQITPRWYPVYTDPVTHRQTEHWDESQMGINSPNIRSISLNSAGPCTLSRICVARGFFHQSSMSDFAVTPSVAGVHHAPEISHSAADKVASLLQRNHDSFHVFWNFKGYHNHQVHYLLTAYALGANRDQLQVAYDANTAYQRPRLPIDEGLVLKLSNDRMFQSCAGNDTYFNDYTVYFQRQFEEHGWPQVVKRYLFSRSETAEDLLVGLFAGTFPTQRAVLTGRCGTAADGGQSINRP